ncbi:unnamed protein product, partial [Mesorhabditis belari]|uniref:NADAR domain-containing protein n=1 Tax=Mesorhabditis belari TaxID=2138241 RepID=A0AAF3ESX5_9BILA
MGTFQRRSKETDEIFTLFFTVASPFSNFHPCRFTAILGNDKLHKFCCVEQYYMYHKAMAADNESAAEQILRETVPRNIKKIGSELESLDYQRWKVISPGIMRQALFLKYENNEELRKLLFLTRGSTLVEASPTDCTWGIGLSLDDPGSSERSRWRGRNQLGMIMTAVREDLWYRDVYQKDREIIEKTIQEPGYFEAYFANIQRLPFEKARDRKRFKEELNVSLQESPQLSSKRPRFSPKSERREKRSRRRSPSRERNDRRRSPSRERNDRRRGRYDEKEERSKYARSSRDEKEENGKSRKRKRSRERSPGRSSDTKDSNETQRDTSFKGDSSGSRHARIKFDLNEEPPQPAPLEKSITGQKRLLSLLQQEKKKMQLQVPSTLQVADLEVKMVPEAVPITLGILPDATLEIIRHFNLPSTIERAPPAPPPEPLVEIHDEEHDVEEPFEFVPEATFLDIPLPESPLPKVRRPQSRSPTPVSEENSRKKRKRKDDDGGERKKSLKRHKHKKHRKSRRHRSTSNSSTASRHISAASSGSASSTPSHSRSKDKKRDPVRNISHGNNAIAIIISSSIIKAKSIGVGKLVILKVYTCKV